MSDKVEIDMRPSYARMDYRMSGNLYIEKTSQTLSSNLEDWLMHHPKTTICIFAVLYSIVSNLSASAALITFLLDG
jgi:hypothetical protein